MTNQGHELFSDLCGIIDGARQRVASVANSTITLMYWTIGHRINTEILHHTRAQYGKQIVDELSMQLQTRYGKKGTPSDVSRHLLHPKAAIVGGMARRAFSTNN